MRPRFPRLAFLAAATVAAAATIAGCGTPGSSGDRAEQPIVIGASLSLTGAFGPDGQAFERGYKLWQAVVNEHGGILGRPVRLIILNDKSDPNKAVANYKTLITADHVDMTFGPFSSLLTAPSSAEVGKYGFAMIEGAGTAPTVFNSASNAKYHNVFSPSLPVEKYMQPLISWISSLPASQRPTSAAYPTANSIFAQPAVQTAQAAFQRLKIKTVYPAKTFNEGTTTCGCKRTAELVAAAHAQMVVLGSTAVSTVQTFMQAFHAAHYNPKVFIATSGPDQGQQFLGSVGVAMSTGVMVPNGWYGGYSNALSNAMVEEYIARYGGTADQINADVAEAYSVGEVAADAIGATGGTNQRKIIHYLHNLAGTKLETVQGSAQFLSNGENTSQSQAAFISQWQYGGNFVQVLPSNVVGSTKIIYPKPANW